MRTSRPGPSGSRAWRRRRGDLPPRRRKADRFQPAQLMHAVPDHVTGNEQHDGQADVADPRHALQQPGDQGGGEAGQQHRQAKTGEQHPTRLVAHRAGHGQHVVERGGDVGDEYLHQHAGQRPRLRCRARLVLAAHAAQIPPHLPADQQQQQATRQHQAWTADLQQLHGEEGEGAKQHDREAQPEHDRPAPQRLRQSRRGHADRNGVVAGEAQVDQHDLSEGCEEARPVHASGAAVQLTHRAWFGVKHR
jgi:hypothetical protein